MSGREWPGAVLATLAGNVSSAINGALGKRRSSVTRSETLPSCPPTATFASRAVGAPLAPEPRDPLRRAEGGPGEGNRGACRNTSRRAAQMGHQTCAARRNRGRRPVGANTGASCCLRSGTRPGSRAKGRTQWLRE